MIIRNTNWVFIFDNTDVVRGTLITLLLIFFNTFNDLQLSYFIYYNVFALIGWSCKVRMKAYNIFRSGRFNYVTTHNFFLMTKPEHSLYCFQYFVMYLMIFDCLILYMYRFFLIDLLCSEGRNKVYDIFLLYFLTDLNIRGIGKSLRFFVELWPFIKNNQVH